MWTRLYVRRVYKYITTCDIHSGTDGNLQFFGIHTRGKTRRQGLYPGQGWECGPHSESLPATQSHHPRAPPPWHHLPTCFSSPELRASPPETSSSFHLFLLQETISGDRNPGQLSTEQKIEYKTPRGGLLKRPLSFLKDKINVKNLIGWWCLFPGM